MTRFPFSGDSAANADADPQSLVTSSLTSDNVIILVRLPNYTVNTLRPF